MDKKDFEDFRHKMVMDNLELWERVKTLEDSVNSMNWKINALLDNLTAVYKVIKSLGHEMYNIDTKE